LGHLTSAKAQETGTLSVTTTPVSGAIYVDNVLRGIKFWSGDLDVGSHVVSFGNVDGYIAPPAQTVTVIANQTYYIVGAYRKLFSLPESGLISSFWTDFRRHKARMRPCEWTEFRIIIDDIDPRRNLGFSRAYYWVRV
jgi:hypothetical protein